MAHLVERLNNFFFGGIYHLGWQQSVKQCCKMAKSIRKLIQDVEEPTFGDITAFGSGQSICPLVGTRTPSTHAHTHLHTAGQGGPAYRRPELASIGARWRPEGTHMCAHVHACTHAHMALQSQRSARGGKSARSARGAKSSRPSARSQRTGRSVGG